MAPCARCAAVAVARAPLNELSTVPTNALGCTCAFFPYSLAPAHAPCSRPFLLAGCLPGNAHPLAVAGRATRQHCVPTLMRPPRSAAPALSAAGVGWRLGASPGGGCAAAADQQSGRQGGDAGGASEVEEARGVWEQGLLAWRWRILPIRLLRQTAVTVGRGCLDVQERSGSWKATVCTLHLKKGKGPAAFRLATKHAVPPATIAYTTKK